MPNTRKKGRVAARTRKPAAAQARPEDFEDLIVGLLVKSGSRPSNCADIEDLLYRTTSGLSDIGYGSGISVGRNIALKLGSGCVIADLLDRTGLHGSLYHPLKDVAIITRRHAGEAKPRLNTSVHVYESGLISGFLSSTTGMQVNTEERRCVYNGSTECQFVAKPMSPRPKFEAIGIDSAVEAIAEAVIAGRYARNTPDYRRVLACMPLTEPRISDQILKMMEMSGWRISEKTGWSSPADLAARLSDYFGLRGAEAERRGIKSIIKLRCESYNSMRNFAAMPAAIMAGFASAAGFTAKVGIVAGRNKVYTSVIELSKKRA